MTGPQATPGPQVTYQEFKVVEVNIREAFTRIHELADGVRTLNTTVSDAIALLRDMQVRLSRVEAQVYGEAGGPHAA